MAQSVTFRSVDRRSDRVFLNWDDEGVEIDGGKPSDIIAWAQSRLPQDTSMLVALFIMSLAARDPSLSRLAAYAGDTITLDAAKDFFAPGAQLTVKTNG